MTIQLTTQQQEQQQTHPDAPQGTAAHLWAAMHNEEIVARVLTAVTFIAMIVGLILQNRGEGEGIGAWAWGAYAIAYLAGGYFGVQAGWASLREWRIDVDLLMILAAVGAALVGAPFEGALLLFLFSLSNVLRKIMPSTAPAEPSNR